MESKKSLKKNRALILAFLIMVLYLIFSLVFKERYFTLENIFLVLLNMAAEAPIVIGICLLLIMGEIDLSLGALMVLGAMLCGRFMLYMGIPMAPAILLCILISMIIGGVNGFIVAQSTVPAFIATMAMSQIIMGIAIITAGSGWSDFQDPVFVAMGSMKLFGYMQMPVLYALILLIIFAILTEKNRFFRRIYFIGGNAKASEFSGINIKRTKITVFMFSAALASFCGIVSAMRFNTAMTSIGTGVELRAVTACVIGGVSFTGGRGTVWGAAMGSLLIACLNNILTMFHVSPDLQFVVTGIVLVLAILLDSTVNRQKKGKIVGEETK